MARSRRNLFKETPMRHLPTTLLSLGLALGFAGLCACTSEATYEVEDAKTVTLDITGMT
ncbi:MAG: hypothetical protein QF903_13160 [Planctomycetota bacterium]|jgi:hypothetical protein|nr:hypothetical protein [Planctomycetota bacterium]MDP6764254.1 hypothetical protein [Planctomycetota bacterium]MDP6990412.1 hypothetical protein [Planctomycetota bacterium]